MHGSRVYTGGQGFHKFYYGALKYENFRDASKREKGQKDTNHVINGPAIM